eukprot:5879345-Karenia_brevis.AAC.1
MTCNGSWSSSYECPRSRMKVSDQTLRINDACNDHGEKINLNSRESVNKTSAGAGQPLIFK